MNKRCYTCALFYFLASMIDTTYGTGLRGELNPDIQRILSKDGGQAGRELEGQCWPKNVCQIALDNNDNEFFDSLTVPAGVESFGTIILASQPNCNVTCNDYADEFFIELNGLETSAEVGTPNQVSYGEAVTDQGILDRVQSSFDNIAVMTKKQRECVLDYQSHEGQPYYEAAITFYQALNQFAPYINGTACDQQLGSMGLYYNTKYDEVQSLCNPDSPGKQFNSYMRTKNESGFTALFEACGYVFEDDYFSDITQGIGCYGVMTAGLCQTDYAAAGGNHNACYCVMHPAEGIRCPMYGPIYYMNQRIVYQVGGMDYVKAMPGKRVKCAQDDTNNCAGMCRSPSIDDFPACSVEKRKRS